MRMTMTSLALLALITHASLAAPPAPTGAPALIPAPPEIQAAVKGTEGFAREYDERPVRLIAEAEDFKIEKGEWVAVPFRENYFASTFAMTFLSRMACLGAPAQPETESIAAQIVDVPYESDYHLLARYEQPYNFSVEFTLVVEQDGQQVFKQIFGKLDDSKIWPLNGHVRKPMERFWWGGTDNQVWQQAGPAHLKKGKATIRMIAGKQMDGDKLRVNTGRRSVDLICLTNDEAGMAAQKKSARYLEMDGWLVQAGDLYIRITNKGTGPVVPTISPDDMGQHSPYYIHARDWAGVSVLKTGRLEGKTNYQIAGPRSASVAIDKLAPLLRHEDFLAPKDPNKPDGPKQLVFATAHQLAPGDTSGWVPMGHVTDALHNCTWTLKTPSPLGLEFGVPDGAGGIKSIRQLDISGTTVFEVPANIAPNPAIEHALKTRWWLPQLRTVPEAIAWLGNEVAKFPDKGPIAKRFLIFSIGGFGSTPSTPEGQKLMLALGDNTVVNQGGKKKGVRFHMKTLDLAQLAKQDFSDTLIVSYGDETHLPEAPLTDDELSAWLKAHNVDWTEPVKFTRTPTDPLFYYSTIAGVEKGAQPYIAATEFLRSKGVYAGANYSPHANYMVSEMHWVRPFKLKAMSLPWSEDYVWQIPEFSVQVAGYMTTAFRCGAKYHDMPIHMYVMPHSPGNTPRDFRLSAYTCVANGAKQLDYFCASPLAVGGTENYVATDDLPMWREIHAVSHEAGKFEDYVMDGHVRGAQVGLLLSSVDDIMSGASNQTLAMHNGERKAVYYALKHAGIPVDMITEDDVIDGLAKECKVIYLTQQWVHSRAVKALKTWVENGGTLVALCGGGFRNEFNKDNPEVNALFGVKSQAMSTDPDLVKNYIIAPNTPFLVKQDLPLYKPMDTVSSTATPAQIPVIVWKQTLEPAGANVLATFSDGKPAVVETKHGKGRAILFGFLPGQAYLKSGLPILPPDRGAIDAAFSHFLPTEMDTSLRALFVDSLMPADFVRPVECSAKLIETACIDTPAKDGNPARLAVPLMNYSGTPVKELTVKIADLPAAKSLRSVERGALTPTFKDGAMVVTLPLDVADMLLIDR